MDLQITPRKLIGSVTPPPSKSMAHRLIIAAALSSGVSTVENIALSQDISATLRCIEALGAGWEEVATHTLRIHGFGGRAWEGDLPHFDCGESGSTLRFFIPIALAVAGGGIFTGQGRLMQRPQQPYFDLFAEKGISCVQEGDTLTVRGRLMPGEFRLAGNVSSQFFTGLLFALPLLAGDSTLSSTTALESRSYVDMTLQALETFDIRAEAQDTTFRIPGGQLYAPRITAAEADWSQAAFWYAANFLDNPVEIRGMNAYSTQGDMIVARHYWQLARPDTDVEIDLSNCPDLLPPLAVMAAVRRGTTRFTNAARLRMKESDRLTAVCRMLGALGGRAEEGADHLTVHGVPALRGGTVDGCGDHRIVMAAAIAATACTEPVTIPGAEAVAKSYPDFFEIYRSLGGAFCVI